MAKGAYRVTIEQTELRTVLVEAESEAEAVKIAVELEGNLPVLDFWASEPTATAVLDAGGANDTK